uniref:Putative secreted protein n=1 Tax=Ixodes ricinus TaxID=34613 RepID=A0A6B0U4B0_IXORI
MFLVFFLCMLLSGALFFTSLQTFGAHRRHGDLAASQGYGDSAAKCYKKNILPPSAPAGDDDIQPDAAERAGDAGDYAGQRGAGGH